MYEIAIKVPRSQFDSNFSDQQKYVGLRDSPVVSSDTSRKLRKLEDLLPPPPSYYQIYFSAFMGFA